MSIMLEQPLGDVVTTLPGSARVLESFGLDYCCGGQRPLADACAEAGVDPEVVVGALGAIEPAQLPDWASMGPAELVDHLESTHHAYLHTELPRLDALAEKVASVHGANHPELMDVLADVRELRDDLEPHLMKEERILFPLIREQVGAPGSGADAAAGRSDLGDADGSRPRRRAPGHAAGAHRWVPGSRGRLRQLPGPLRGTRTARGRHTPARPQGEQPVVPCCDARRWLIDPGPIDRSGRTPARHDRTHAGPWTRRRIHGWQPHC